MSIHIGDRLFFPNGPKHKVIEIALDGTYHTQIIAATVRHSKLAKLFKREDIIPGATLLLPTGKRIKLVALRDTGFWDCLYPEVHTFSPEQIEQLLAEAKAASDYSSVATRRESIWIEMERQKYTRRRHD